jgi:hypothetical protein
VEVAFLRPFWLEGHSEGICTPPVQNPFGPGRIIPVLPERLLRRASVFVMDVVTLYFEASSEIGRVAGSRQRRWRVHPRELLKLVS